MRKLNGCVLGRWLCFWLALAPSAFCFGAPVITEFLAANDSLLADEDGEFSDWIEIHNPGTESISLARYYLTDEATDLRKWMLPAIDLEPGGYLVVFASGKNRASLAGPVHTNFRLSAEGGYLALVAPDVASVVSAFGPVYPPQFEDESFGLDPAGSAPAWSYFATPTPGAANGSGRRSGPIVRVSEPNPPQPVTGPLVIKAVVLPVNDAVATVRLYYRRMYGPETMVPMTDDGTGGDAGAGDGVWTATIPDTAFAPGEMTRWRLVATDANGVETKEPAFHDPVDSHQYFGTVAHDERIRSNLPVFHWFTTSPVGANTLTGSRGAVYYEGEFHDNVLFSLHGQSSAGFPKKSYNIDFNRTQRFQWRTNAPRVADIDLLTNWADKSKVRHVLAYEVMRQAGVAAHFAFTVRVQQNGRFFSTADFVEDADEIYLERAGLNRDGALYKVYDNLLNKDAGNTGTSGVEKKTRRFENHNDLQMLIDGLDLTGQAWKQYFYDHIDIPSCVNLLAANSVVRNIDMHSKNWYAYCDTGRSGEWAILPWDLDLSFGRVWNTQNTYFDNALYTDSYVVNSTAIRLFSQMFADPALRAMILRRIRTLTDRYLQPPPEEATPEDELYCERRLNEQSALMNPPDIVPSDARVDFEKWGSWLQGGTPVPYTNTSAAVETMAEAIQRWKTEYLPARRQFIYGTQTADRGGEIPLPQTGAGPTTNFTALVVKGAAAKALVPANGSLGLNWTGDPALEPLNTAGWVNGVTGVGYERASGYATLIGLNVDTLMRNNNSVYIRIEFDVPDATAFDRLELRLKFDDGFAAFLNGSFLTSAFAPASLEWNSAATLSHEANVNAFTVYDVSDKLAALRSGRNVLAIQGLNDSLSSSDMIVVPEVHGGKLITPTTLEPRIDFGAIEATPASGNQDEEFIELRNPHSLAVDLSDWRLRGAVRHTFRGGTVLPPGGVLYVCPDAAAFRGRAVPPKGGEGRFVQGGYQGHLSSAGTTIDLIESSGMTNNTATYTAEPSDAQRYLVISELMYHPLGDGLAEFVELLNSSSSVTLDLRGVRFTQGVEFDFTHGEVTLLPPGERVLVVRDRAAFHAVHGTNHPVAGVFEDGTALSNGGERITLQDADDVAIRTFAYEDSAPWPPAADAGYSLTLIAPETNPDSALAVNWRSSVRLGGSPGRPDVLPPPVDPEGDLNHNGERDLIDYVLGNDLGLPPIQPTFVLQPEVPGGPLMLRLSYPVSLNTQSAQIDLFLSTDLTTWESGAAHLELISREPLGDGRELVSWRVKPPLGDAARLFLRLRATLE